MAQSYKTLKEDFVSNLSGGQISEINYVTAVAPAAVLLWSALQSRQDFFNPYGPLAFFADFLLNICAILLATTLYSSFPVLLTSLLILPALFLLTFSSQGSLRKKPPKSPSTSRRGHPTRDQVELDLLPVRPFITSYRGTMMIVTCVAILAVDFKIFPRRFAKVETWGTSLMDMGVGSFVFSAGIVSARPMIKDALAGRSSPIGSRLLRSLRHSLPLFVFGLVRLYAVKGLDFAEHVSEYGVHWNFFFTLALLPPSIALLQSLLAAVPSISILALFLGALYELSLHFTNLQRYVLTSARTNILNQNREGIFSFFGYLSIFLAGQAVGLIALPRMVERKGIAASGKALRRDLLIRLTRYSIIWSSLMFLASSSKFGFDLKVSRRLANLPYILWVSAFNCTQLTVFCVIETLLFPGVYKAVDKDSEKKECNNATSRILKAYNRNGLAIFLLANPLTGLVNKTVDTLNIDRIGAIGILIVYTGLLTGVAMALDQMDLSIKF